MSAPARNNFRERLLDAALALRLLSEQDVLCRFTLPFGTPPEHLDSLPGRAREVVHAHAGTSFGGARLERISASGLEFEIGYRILSTSQANFLATQIAIVRGLVEAAQLPMA
jgi:hypothetical protein